MIDKSVGKDVVDMLLDTLQATQAHDPKFRRAFKEFFWYPENFDELRTALVKWHELLVTYGALQAIDEFIELAVLGSDEEFVNLNQHRRELIENVRTRGLQSTLDEMRLVELLEALPPQTRLEFSAVTTKEDMVAVTAKSPEAEAFYLEWLRQSDPEWVALLEEIHSIEQQTLSLNLPHEMPARIALDERAIALLESRGRSEYWARFQGELANSHAKNSLGRINENIDKALHHYGLALEFFNHEEYPVEWAMTQFNLGNLYGARLNGDRVDNEEQAIYHYLEALTIIKRDKDAMLWADIQHALGNSYLARNPDRPKRLSDVEEAITRLEAAKQVYLEHPDATDDDRGMVGRSLGTAYAALG